MCGLIFLSFGGEDVADYAFRTLEDRQKIERLWEDGRTPKEISETTGVRSVAAAGLGSRMT